MSTFAMKDLFERLDISGSNLLLRSYGRQAFPILQSKLEKLPPGESLHLDFEGISVMDASFSDESVVELAVKLISGDFDDRFLVLENLSSATVDNLEGTLARRGSKVALLIQDEDKSGFIGHLERNLVEVWQLVNAEGVLTARTLADQMSLQINTASTRLHKLYKNRLLARREETTETGRHHVYGLPQ